MHVHVHMCLCVLGVCRVSESACSPCKSPPPKRHIHEGDLVPGYVSLGVDCHSTCHCECDCVCGMEHELGQGSWGDVHLLAEGV